MRNTLKILAIVLVALAVQGCMVRATDYKALQDTLAVTQAEIDGYQSKAAVREAELAELQTDYEMLTAQLDDKDARIAKLQITPRATVELTRIWEKLEMLARGRKDMRWDSTARKLLVSVEFFLGSAGVKPSGKSAIKQIAAVLKSMPPGHVAYIDGHTDDLPVKNPRTVEKFVDNRGLSDARALAVYRVLREGGVAPKLMISRGFGEYYPVVPNKDEGSRAKNRRVEISVVPESAAFAPTAMLVPESGAVFK